MTGDDAVLHGGPRNGTTFAAEGATLLELQIDGMVHRYLRTDRTEPAADQELTVYAYDGLVRTDRGGE